MGNGNEQRERGQAKENEEEVVVKVRGTSFGLISL
jgi:hypothetical protein